MLAQYRSHGTGQQHGTGLAGLSHATSCTHGTSWCQQVSSVLAWASNTAPADPPMVTQSAYEVDASTSYAETS